MQPAEVPKSHSAAGLVPVPQPATPWRVVAVEPQREMCLRVSFIDGTAGEVRLRSFLESPQVTGTVFELLRDPQFFDRVHVELGAVAWPNGADLAPDAMYDAIRAYGYWDVAA